jgi:hypothetical protein
VPVTTVPVTTVPIDISQDELDSDGSGDTDQCRLDPSSGERPSIGEVARSIDPSLLPEGVGGRAVGLALVTLVDQGELCLEDVVAYVDQAEETDDFRSALEAVLADLATPSG